MDVKLKTIYKNDKNSWIVLTSGMVTLRHKWMKANKKIVITNSLKFLNENVDKKKYLISI